MRIKARPLHPTIPSLAGHMAGLPLTTRLYLRALGGPSVVVQTGEAFATSIMSTIGMCYNKLSVALVFWFFFCVCLCTIIYDLISIPFALHFVSDPASYSPDKTQVRVRL